jgi:antitoxin (DNA-binding transcriptional repressor) of toxin-antitoxin stability system
METKSITATEAARNFSEVINQVRYQAAEFDVTRGKEIVARIVPPPKLPVGFPLRDLTALFASLPGLEAGDADDFLKDIDASVSRLTMRSSEWD